MLNTPVAVFLLQIVAPPQSGVGLIHGMVRADDTGNAIVAAKIELADGARTVYSDSTGAYEMSSVAPGSHRLRFVAQSYDTLVVDILVAGDAALRLDVGSR